MIRSHAYESTWSSDCKSHIWFVCLHLFPSVVLIIIWCDWVIVHSIFCWNQQMYVHIYFSTSTEINSILHLVVASYSGIPFLGLVDAFSFSSNQVQNLWKYVIRQNVHFKYTHIEIFACRDTGNWILCGISLVYQVSELKQRSGIYTWNTSI